MNGDLYDTPLNGKTLTLTRDNYGGIIVIILVFIFIEFTLK